MGQIQIITDSASDMAPDLAESLKVKVVPLTIRFGDEVFTDVIDISVDEFYEKMRNTKELPQTSAPSPGQFEEAYRQAMAEGADTVIAITLSSKLSATGQSAEIAAKNMEGELKVHNIDSLSVTVGEGFLVKIAAEMAKAGHSAEEICVEVESLIDKLYCYGVLDNLENLKRGGRIGPAKAMFASALNIKPIVDLSTGEVEPVGRVRTRHKSFMWLRDKIVEIGSPQMLGLYHAGAEDFTELLRIVGEVTDVDKIYTGKIGPVIATHTGLGIIGLGYIK